MKIEKVLIQSEGKIINITDLPREQYERFLALMNALTIEYDIRIKQHDETIYRHGAS